MPYLMGDDDLLGDYVLGDSLLGEEELLGRGAIRRARQRVVPIRRRPVNQQLAAFARGGAAKGREWVLPFTGTSTLTVAAPSTSLTAQPQKGFVGRRLVIDLGRNGTTAQTALVTVTSIAVGTDPQQAALGAFPASIFSATAIGTNMSWDLGRPGISMTLGLAQTGLTMTDTISTSAGVIGSTTPYAAFPG